jgi:ferredoxin-NADP reductase
LANLGSAGRADGLRNASNADYLCGEQHGSRADAIKGRVGGVAGDEEHGNIVDTVTASPEIAAAPAPAADALIEVRLTAIRYAARDTNLYEFQRPDGKPLPAYAPGAHIDLHLPNGLVRNYSLTVAKPEPGTYTFGIKRDPASRGGSRHVHDELRVGKTVKISAPRNNFPLTEDAAHSILFAGGIGITPIWCMVQRLAELGRSWALYYACRSRADMAFIEALENMPPAHLHFDDEHAGQVLDIAAIVAGLPREAQLYCCGPAPMLRAFEAATADWPRPQIHVEYFTPKAEPARKGGFTVELARSGQEFFIPEGQSILGVLLDEGVDVDYSCELGICGACEQRVIAGVPEHRDSILTEEEQAENKRVMICCAGCKTERLVLDI